MVYWTDAFDLTWCLLYNKINSLSDNIKLNICRYVDILIESQQTLN